MMIIQIYAPTDSEKEDFNQFYYQVQSEIKGTWQQDRLLVVEDNLEDISYLQQPLVQNQY